MRGRPTRRFRRRSPRRSGPFRRRGSTSIRWRPLRVETLENRLLLSTFTVTNTLDSGAGSLRWAIDEANASAGPDEIAFNIPGPGPHSIQPLSALPVITAPVLIDGYTQPGAVPNTSPTGQQLNTVLKTELDGSLAGAGVDGLKITGGGTTIRGLAVNRFDDEGIVLSGSDGNVVQGNFIGTDLTGTVALGNGSDGVSIQYGAQSNLIGTDGDGLADEAERNLISGNLGYGIRIAGEGTDFNVVAGNYIGTDVAGREALPNARSGVFIADDPMTAEGARSNLIGTNGDGVADAVEGNLISGNAGAGVALTRGAADNVLAGNLIGTDATGTAALGNGSHGVSISERAQSNRIGTNGDGLADAAEGNVISGNGKTGISVIESINGVGENVIAGNFIGTDVTGTQALGNGGHGVRLWWGASSNILGTDGDGVADAAEANVISGNGLCGVELQGTPSERPTDNVLAGNFIGTDVTGTVALGNGSHGVWIHRGAQSNRIGTNGDRVADTLEGNVISGNQSFGIALSMGATGNLVAGNRIGTDVSATLPLPNVKSGISINTGAQGNTIGGAASLANTIAFNGEVGVEVHARGPGDEPIATANRIRANSIFANGALGIDLGDDGVTPNDPGDADTGPNQLQNYPVIIAAEFGTATRVVGTLNSTPETEFVLDFYANAAADPSGYGEGERWLGSAVLTTDASGDADFDLLLPAPTTVGELVTATATDPEGNTSEFSQAEAAELDHAGGNQAPTAIDDAYCVEENTPLVVGPESGVLVNDSDADGSPATPLASLVVTEINYNPYEPTADELADNPALDNEDFEFIELQNVGDETIDLTGVRFTTGISFDFTGSEVTELAPGQTVLVVANREAIQLRYIGPPDVYPPIYPPMAGEFCGGLSNDGEQIVLVDSSGSTIHDFTYDDSGDWPTSADGDGSTLEVVDVTGDYNDPANWTASDQTGGTPFWGTNQTVHHDVLAAVLVDPPQNGTLDVSDDGSLSYVPHDGFVGTDTFTYQATDGQLESNVATVTIHVSEVLGPITFLEINDQDPSGGDLWYEFSATRDALMTIDARFDGPADAVQLTLYDENLVELAQSTGSEGNQRIDYPASPGSTFHLKLSGTSSDVDLRLVNLVHKDETSATVYGTDGDDWFMFEACVPPPEVSIGAVDRRVTINGVAYTFTLPTIPPPVFSVTFDGGLGDDSAVFYGSGGNDWGKLWPGHARMTGFGYTVSTTSTESAAAYGNGGMDVAQLFDSPAADSFCGSDQWGWMSGPGFGNAAHGFCYVHAYASDDGQADVAHFNPGLGGGDLRADSSGEPELFRAWPNQACLAGAGYYTRAKGFDQVDAYAMGPGAVVMLYDSPGPDVFDAYARSAVMTYGDGKTVEVHAFRWIHAYASPGAIDTSNLYDTTADGPTSYHSTFDARVAADGRHCSRMFAGGVGAFYNRVLCFELTRAVCEPGGNDVAVLYDSSGADVFEAYADRGMLTYADGAVVEAQNFRYLHAVARNGGLDTATLHDRTTTGTGYATTLLGYANSSLLYTGYHRGLVRAWDFDQTRVALSGGDDGVRLYDDPARVDRLVVPFLGDGSHAAAKAKFSNDRRQLYIDDFASLWATTSEDHEDEAEIDAAYADEVILDGDWVEL